MRYTLAVILAVAFASATTVASACPGMLNAETAPKTTVASGEKGPGSTKIQVPTKG